MSGPTIGIQIGKTNAYVAVNGQMVSNADGTRNTVCMVNEDKSVGLAAQQKWVRMPDSNVAKDRIEFWQALVADLKTTIESNSGEKFENCVNTFVSEDNRCIKYLESLKNNKIKICSCPENLILEKYYDQKASKIALLRFGGTAVTITSINYDNKTKSYKTTDSQTITNLGVSNLIILLRDFLAESFCRKHRIPKDELSARSKRKLELNAKQVLQALSSTNQASVHVDSLHDGIDFTMSVSRGRFEDLALNQITKIVNLISENTEQSIIYGGGANIPLFKRLIGSKSNCTILNEECLAILASSTQISKDRLSTLQLQSSSTNIYYGDEILCTKNQPVPLLQNGTLEFNKTKNYISCTEGQLSEQLEKINPDDKIQYILCYTEKNCQIMFRQNDVLIYELVF